MKKLKVLGLAMLLSISSVFAQKVIENPAYKARNNPIVDIVKIELWDSATVIYCNATFRPKYWIKVPATTFIQSTEGGEKLGISSAEGIAIDEEFFMPESGETSFVPL